MLHMNILSAVFEPFVLPKTFVLDFTSFPYAYFNMSCLTHRFICHTELGIN
jgi:hypothetical protein